MPEFVAIWPDSKVINVLELTVSTNTTDGLDQGRTRKQLKQEYLSLVGDLEGKGRKTSYDIVEIASLGHITESSCEAVSDFFPSVTLRKLHHSLLVAARVSVSCSHQIFLAHKSPVWFETRPLFNPI